MPTPPRRTPVLAALVVAMLALGDERLGACSCARGLSTPCRSTSTADLVFVGKVDDIEAIASRTPPLFLDRRVRLRVQERFAGQAAADVVDVFTHSQGSTCGYRFDVGHTYLVYAYRQSDTGLLTTSICSRTTPLNGAGADLRYLRGLAASEFAAGTVKGVARASGPSRGPIAGADVTLESTDPNIARRYSDVTRADGRFEVQAPPGRYRVSVALPAGLWMHDVELALLDPRVCSELSIFAQPDGRIGGRVLDARGMAVPFLPIDVIGRATARDRSAMPASNALTDEAGVFEVARLPPGTYALGLHLSRLNGQSPGSFWFPNGAAESASTVPVGFGERVAGQDVSLPSDVVPLLVQGTIGDPDGQPMADAKLVLSINEGWSWSGANAVTLDAAGRFRLSLIDGRRYRLRFAKAFGAIYRQIDVPEFLAGRDLPPFDLRFDR